MRKLFYLASLAILVAATACNSDDGATLPTIRVSFASTEMGIDSDDDSEQVIVTLSRKAEVPITVEIALAEDGVGYGSHYTASPAAAEGTLSVTIPAGEPSASFTVTKTAGALFDGSESVEFTITLLSVNDGVAIGTNSQARLFFGSILSQGGTMTLEGRGGESDADAAYRNSVWVDLSGNKQTAVARSAWNLAFWCGTEFRVALNGAYGTVATSSGKSTLAEATTAVADALGAYYNLSAHPMQNNGTFDPAILDNPDGSLAGTAFAEVASAGNKVYFVASEPQKTSNRGDWYKVLVTRNGSGYRVQYGKVSGGNITTVDVPKSEGYNFVFLSLETGGLVDAEPKAGRWDIKWSYDVGNSSTMSMPNPIVMQDYVTINNLGGVQVAQVMTAEVSYAAFGAADLAGLAFSSKRDDVIGDRWRSTGGMGGPAGGVKTDRFYVVKDPSGNYYKLRFTKFGVGDDGMRGRPVIEYTLVE